MKTFLGCLVMSLLVGTNCFATISGPSCDELSKGQMVLLGQAAKKHILTKQDENLKISAATIEALNIDCHDYDGVISSAVFELTWVQIDEDQEMECTQEVAVSVDYNAKTKKLTINRKSKFNIEDESDIKCLN